MSSVKIEGNASGTGIFTIASPNSNTNRTLTLPDNTGTIVTTGSSTAITQSMIGTGVAGTGPAFSAYANNAQSISNNTWTKLQVNTELFDTASCFDSTTNYRFTPNVAGYYQVTAAWYSATSTGVVDSAIYKNGSIYQLTANTFYSGGQVLGVNSLVYLNGSTDYIEFYVLQGQGTSYTTLGARSDLYYFQAFLARAA